MTRIIGSSFDQFYRVTGLFGEGGCSLYIRIFVGSYWSVRTAQLPGFYRETLSSSFKIKDTASEKMAEGGKESPSFYTEEVCRAGSLQKGDWALFKSANHFYRSLLYTYENKFGH